MRTLLWISAAAIAASAMPAAAQVVAVPRGVQAPRAVQTFSLPTYEIVEVKSASNTDAEKSVSGKCPAGMKAFSGSANGRSENPAPEEPDGVSVGKPKSLFGYVRGLSDVVSRPSADGAGWSASGKLANANGPWQLELTIVCGRL